MYHGLTENDIENVGFDSPLTLTKMRLSRGTVFELLNDYGVSVNGMLQLHKGAFKLKENDRIKFTMPESLLLEQYHKRVIEMFGETMKKEYQKIKNNHKNNNNNNNINDNYNNNENDSDNNNDNEETDVYVTADENTGETIKDNDWLDSPLLAFDVSSKESNNQNKSYVPFMEGHFKKRNTPMITSEHLYEWLKLIVDQMQPISVLNNGFKTYTKQDILLYEDDFIVCFFFVFFLFFDFLTYFFVFSIFLYVFCVLCVCVGVFACFCHCNKNNKQIKKKCGNRLF